MSESLADSGKRAMSATAPDKPRASVLIGTWNSASTLPRAIDSILEQTFREFELLIVDDGSTDETPEIVRSYDDPRIRYLPIPHMGISRSLNVGLEAARADIVVVQDADDRSHPRRLERQVRPLEARPDIGVVGCQSSEVDAVGNEYARRLPVAVGDVRETLMHFDPVPNTCAAIRRDVALAVGGYDPRYRYAMDYDLMLRVADRHGVLNLSDELVARLFGDTTCTPKERAQIREAIRMRLATMRRRRSIRGAAGLIRPMVSLAVPLRVKQALRRFRGQAP